MCLFTKAGTELNKLGVKSLVTADMQYICLTFDSIVCKNEAVNYHAIKVCEGNSQSIVCHRGEKISIVDSYYGREGGSPTCGVSRFRRRRWDHDCRKDSLAIARGA